MRKLLVKSYYGDYQLYEKKIMQPFFLGKSNKILYVIDKNVYNKNKFLSKIKKKIILVKSEENSKSYKNIAKIIQSILKRKINRDYEICGVGGGIVQDITGFVASILFRGIKWNYVPTTILSQCDSCIGGKTSINFGQFKNQLGNFYPPKNIYLDTNFLKTLNVIAIKSGLGEMAHYYLVGNKKEWNFFKKNLDSVLEKNFNKEVMKKLIFKSLKIKKKFIEKDEFDTGHRLILNYGHTFGHAIEKITNYDIPHGLAVAHGINMSNFFSLQLKLINKKIFKEIEYEISKIVKLSKIHKINVKYFLETLKKDKKSKNNQVRIVLTKGYGKMFLKSFKKNSTIVTLLEKYFRYLKTGYLST